MHSFAAIAAHSPVVLATSNSSVSGTVFPLIILFVIVIMFLTTRRNKRRSAEAQQTTLEPGVEIVTRSGMLGVVVLATEDEVTIEVAPGVHVRMLRAAILNRNELSAMRGRGRGARGASAWSRSARTTEDITSEDDSVTSGTPDVPDAGPEGNPETHNKQIS